jgi:two-component system CheB/CheR fusion protein
VGRLNALARAHDLVLRGFHANGQIIREATLTRLVEAIFQPYTDLARTGDPKRIVISGSDLVIGERALTSLALVLHELATNAAKYGALSIGQGVVRVTWQIADDNLLLRWEERKGPAIKKTPTNEGFGSILVRRSIVGQLGGELDYIWKPEGFSAFISIPMERSETLLLCHPRIVGKYRPWERRFPWERCVAESSLGIDCRRRALYRSRSCRGR